MLIMLVILAVCFHVAGCMTDMNLFNCNLCAYSADSFFAFRNHFVRHHKNDPHFYVACCIDSCAYTCKSWTAYRVHVHRKHRNVLVVPSGSAEITENECDDFEDTNEHVQVQRAFDPLHFNAQFTLALEAKHNLSQCAVDNVVSSTEVLFERHLSFFKAQLKSKLSEMHVNPSVVDDVPVSSFLSEFQSNGKRIAHYRKNINTYIEPQEVVLGYKFVSKNGSITRSPRLGYIIPFERSIHNLLSMPEVWWHIQHSHQTADEFMYDICDGNFVQSQHPFRNNAEALEVVLNCDDMEIVNPLGSHVKKHKVSMFYYTLANIPPEYRSKTDVIQLLAVARTRDLRDGNTESKLLADFCNTIRRMSGQGIDMHLHGDVKRITGNLIIVCADTLAANWLGKFKEGVSFAKRNCRHCEIENERMRAIVVERDVALRNLDEHKTRCRDLELLSPVAYQYWSRM